MDSNGTIYRPYQEQPELRILPEKKMVGQQVRMSLANNGTAELWKNFAPRIKDIENRVGTKRYSMQFYDAGYFERFNPATDFTKKAAVEVSDLGSLPAGMEGFTLASSLYAVWLYKGSSSDGRIFQYIFSTWLPASDYELDNRPHFEVLGEKYRNNDPDSEEEIWIPVKKKRHN
jgi:AraC family transcriptional regulator